MARSKKDLERAYRILSKSDDIGVDTETTGLDPNYLTEYEDDTEEGKREQVPTEVLSVQFSDGETSVLVPVNEGIKLGPLAKILKDEKYLKIFHNAKFDYKFLAEAGYEVNNIYDTMLGEQLLTAGLGFPCDLGSLARRYLNIKLNKAARTTFYDGTFTEWTDELVDYATDDVWILPEIMKLQWDKLCHHELDGIMEMELGLLPVVAKMEMLGVYVDVEEVKAFAAEMETQAETLRLQISERLEPYWNQSWRKEFAQKSKVYMEWKIAYDQKKSQATVKAFDEFWSNEYSLRWDQEIAAIRSREEKAVLREKRDAQYEQLKQHWLDKYKPLVADEKNKKPYKTKPKERGPINVSSGAQLRDALAEAGIHLPNMRKETLADAVGQHELLDHVLEFKKYEKLKQMAVLDQFVSPITGMIHCTLNQCGAGTGRFSCKEPNLQQVPARTDEGKRMRKLFKASGPDRRLVVADYAAIELVIIAAESRDEALLTAIRDSSIDLHVWTMSKFLGCKYDALMLAREGKANKPSQMEPVIEARQRFQSLCTIPELEKVEDLQKWIKKLRDVVKTLTYGIAYGLSEYGLARKFHFDAEDGKSLIALFFNAYPKVKVYLDKRAEQALRYGYSTTAMGRKRFFKKPTPVNTQTINKAISADYVIDELPPDTFGRLYREYKRKLEKEYWFREQSIRRQGANHAIQGASADMTKLALLNIARELREEGYKPSDYPRLPVHDEILMDVSAKHADDIARLLEKAMEDAAHEVLPKDLGLKIKVEANVCTEWEK